MPSIEISHTDLSMIVSQMHEKANPPDGLVTITVDDDGNAEASWLSYGKDVKVGPPIDVTDQVKDLEDS